MTRHQGTALKDTTVETNHIEEKVLPSTDLHYWGQKCWTADRSVRSRGAAAWTTRKGISDELWNGDTHDERIPDSDAEI